MKQKTHKALMKRVKITKTGKVLTRKCGQDHFNGREGGKTTRAKRTDTLLSHAHRVVVKTLLPYKKN